METVFILSNESRIVKATMSLDEATLWTNSGGFMVEVPFTGGTELLSYIDDNQEIQIQNEDGENLATIEAELYNDPIEHLAHDCSVSFYTNNIEVGRVVVNGTLLEKCNLTKDLVTDIMSNCEELAENELNELTQ